MSSTTNATGETFCSSCFRYRPAGEVKLVPSSNGKQNILRCDSCEQKRQEARAAKTAAAKKVKKVKEAKPNA